MNVHDSERLSGLLEAAGYEPASGSEDADVIVLNTCSVRERAEEKLFTRLGELQIAAPNGSKPVIAVAGCVAQQEGGLLMRRSRAVDVVVGTQAMRRLPLLVDEALSRRAPDAEGPRPPLVDVAAYDDVTFPLGLARRGDPIKAYVTIIEGCNEHCAFCVVPHTRGHERMRPLRAILDEVREAVDTGHPEIHLLGQIVNHYQAPDAPDCDFAELLRRVGQLDGVRRIRFASPHPRHVTPGMIEAMRDVSAVCRHLHLPVQSGSTDVLRLMRRRHSRDDYLGLVDRIRERIPGIALSTDLIVGFPGESDSDFEATLSLVRRVQFSSMFSFKYSARPQTLAVKRMPDDVADEEKTRRIVELQAAQKSIQSEIHQRLVGTAVDVLVDGRSRRRPQELAGRTSTNTVVNFEGHEDLLGRFVRVGVTRAGANGVWGQVVGDDRVSRAESHAAAGGTSEG